MATENNALCPKHGLQAKFVCAVENCHENRLICQVCKQKETLHFSHHANYIYKYGEFKDFNSSAKTILTKLENGLNGCQSDIIAHRKYYSNQINAIQADINTLKQQFNAVASKYEQIFVRSFQKQAQKFDEDIQRAKSIYKEYSKEKASEDSFFSKLFHQKYKSEEDAIQAMVKKNSKAFKIRADIIIMRQNMKTAMTNKAKYKATQIQQLKYQEIRNYLAEFINNLFDRFKQLLELNFCDSESLKSSIVSETKSLGMSRVSLGSPLELLNDMRRSTTSLNSDRSNQQRVPMPEANPVVASVRERLRPLNPPKNITMEGPYLYSTGVYFGQFLDNRRHGWGEFVFTDGSLYQGNWEDDMMSGFGRLIRKNCYFEGEVSQGKANGKGNYQDHHRTYVGEWKDDKRHGMGEEEFKTRKKKYVGQFADDLYNGKGKLHDEEYVYEGKFKDGLFHGDGRINYKNRQTFEGSFKEGQKQMGRQKYPDGSYYDGSFKDNLPEGTGDFYWADGVRYSGRWKNGFQDGKGVQILDNGRELQGVWRAGQWQRWL